MLTSSLKVRLTLAVSALVGLLWLLGAAGSVGWRSVVLAGCLGALGWVLPGAVVRRRAHARRREIDREVPELVDLLVTTVEVQRTEKGVERPPILAAPTEAGPAAAGGAK